MKHKVSELEGALLDAAVAKAAGWADFADAGPYQGWWYRGEGRSMIGKIDFEPSSDWAAGGPIIERERMFVAPEMIRGTYYGNWRAIVHGFEDQGEYAEEKGPTPLIAAMRAYVASRLGEEVELPA